MTYARTHSGKDGRASEKDNMLFNMRTDGDRIPALGQFGFSCENKRCSLRWLQYCLVAPLNRVQKVVGSNFTAPTIFKIDHLVQA
jgi:hypothetical protein